MSRYNVTFFVRYYPKGHLYTIQLLKEKVRNSL